MNLRDLKIVDDAFHEAISMMKKAAKDVAGIHGFGVIELFNPDGLIEVEPFTNLITTAGDQYYAQKAIVGIAPASPSAPTAASGMKLGNASTNAPAKSAAAGADLDGYIAGSNLAFDASFPTASAVGGDAGWNANYKCSWLAGNVTNANIVEAAIVNDAATNATSSVANTYARITFAAKNKTVDDTLAITWSHKFLGA